MTRTFLGTLRFLTLLYYSIVRDIRKSDGNAIRGLFKEISQMLVMMIFFFFLIDIMGLRGVAVRGSFVLYLMSGIFLFLTHNKAVGSITGSGGPTNTMLKHAPVSTLLLILSSALATVYTQIFAMCILLLLAHVLIEPIFFYDFKGFMLCLFIAWITGVAIGLMFLSLTPFIPETIRIVAMVYKRANMLFSGKMFLASTLPGFMLPMFTWNPLFHTIDQARGYVFINYSAKVTTLMYPVILSLVFIVFGMMLEHWARKYASESWASRR